MPRRALPLLGAGLAVVASLLPVASAWAAELSARGPATCPDAGELAFRLERTLGAPLVRSAPLRFDVVFEPPRAEGARYTARLSVRDEHGASRQRVLSAIDCGGLGDAVAVVIALTIGGAPSKPLEPAWMESTLTRPSAPEAVADADGVAGASEASPPAPSDAGPRPSPAAGVEPMRLSPVLALSGVLDAGSLPAPALGVGLEVALRESHWALRVGGTLLFDQRVGVRDAAEAPGAELSMMAGNLAACVVPMGSYRSSSAVFVCAGWELGQLTAMGTGVSAPRAGHQLWSAPHLDAGLSVAIPDTAFRLGLQLTAAVPLKRDDFFLRELGTVHEVPWAVGRFALGADIAF